jgi:hypothetical protein
VDACRFITKLTFPARAAPWLHPPTTVVDVDLVVVVNVDIDGDGDVEVDALR